ncbi:hypothetical protein CG006_01685 [Mesoplasma florum]|uniref:hypothetical protein n=1 Tax=Mesoplasma florum TaxID=2151 RepID=UPI000D03F544|nr:hypothetical protein [Mesoplasma florum]AVN63689.1 hypothetical protein CG006_01685 [Mesoplasma florum]
MKKNKRKILAPFIILLLIVVWSLFLGIMIVNGGENSSSKKIISFQEVKTDVDKYTNDNTFYDFKSYQDGLNDLNIEGVNLTAYQILLENKQSSELTTLRVEVIFKLEKNYIWKELIAGDQKVEYQVVIDKRQVVNKQELIDYVQNSLNEQEYLSQEELNVRFEYIKQDYEKKYPDIKLDLSTNANINDENKTKWTIDIEASIDFNLYKWNDGVEEKFIMKEIKITKDISTLVYQEEIKKELNEIIEKINTNSTKNYSINEVIQEVDQNYFKSANEKLKGTYILNQTAEYQQQTEDGFNMYTIKIKIGLNDGYKWEHDRSKEVKEFSFQNIKINTKIIDLNQVIDDLKVLTSMKFQNTSELEEKIEEISKSSKGYNLDLINKDETMKVNFIATLQISLNEGYVWNDQENTNENITIKLVINKIEK